MPGKSQSKVTQLEENCLVTTFILVILICVPHFYLILICFIIMTLGNEVSKQWQGLQKGDRCMMGLRNNSIRQKVNHLRKRFLISRNSVNSIKKFVLRRSIICFRFLFSLKGKRHQRHPITNSNNKQLMKSMVREMKKLFFCRSLEAWLNFENEGKSFNLEVAFPIFFAATIITFLCNPMKHTEIGWYTVVKDSNFRIFHKTIMQNI